MKQSEIIKILMDNGCPSDLRSNNLYDDFDCLGVKLSRELCFQCWKTALENECKYFNYENEEGD